MPVFEAVNAAEGDTILLRFESPAGRQRLWLIDGGPKASDRSGKRFFPLTDALLPRLKDLRGKAAKTVLDLVVCTHIDDDHINGIERLLRCEAEPGRCGAGENKTVRDAPIAIDKVWFNTFSALMGPFAKQAAKRIAEAPADAALPASVAQGDDLTRHLITLNLAGNSPIDGLVAARPGPVRVNGIDVTILAPGEAELDDLREQWMDESRVVTPRPQDLAPESRLDDSVANLSSIVMLVPLPAPDGGKHLVLLTGDARGDHVVRGYKATGGKVPLSIDVMKVPHHGAYANMHRSLLETFPAKHYVFSANGKHENPDPPVVEALVRICGTRPISLHFTNEVTWSKPFKMEGGRSVSSLREMKAVFDADARFARNVTWLFRDPKAHSIVIEL